MKKKIFIGIGIFILLLFLAIIAIPFIYKGKIIELVKKEANKSLNATINFDNNIQIGIFRSFPNLSVGINKILLVNKAPFLNDTLANIGELSMTLDIMSVLKGDKIKIKTIKLDRAKLYFHVLPDGKANWDVTKADTLKKAATPADTASVFNISLKKYSITNTSIVYNDEALKMKCRIDNLNHEGKGDFTETLFDLSTKTSSTAITYSMDGISYLSKTEFKLDAVLAMDMKKMKFTFKDNELKLNDFILKFNGYVEMPGNDIFMDMSFDAPEIQLKNLISLIPAIFTKDFDKVKTDGKIAFKGNVKGIYNEKTLPGYHVSLSIENGSIQYPSLPTSINNLNIDMKIDCSDGQPDHTVIDIKKMHFALGKEPFNLRLLAKTPISDPYIDATIKGKINLSELKNFMPLPQGTVLNGLMNADLTLKGNYSTIEKEEYEKFQAAGILQFSNMQVKTSDFPQQVDIPSMKLDFTPKNVNLSDMQVKIGKNDLQANGTLSNFIAYFFGKGVLKGQLNLNSQYFDLNSLMSPSTTTTASDTSSLEAIDLPGDIDFTMNAGFKKLIYSNMNLNNVLCNLRLQNKILNIDNMSFNIFNGGIKMKGYYNVQDIKNPSVYFDLGLKNIEFQQAFQTFDIIKKYVAVAQYAKGSFDGIITISTKLDQKLNINYTTLVSNGVLNIPKVSIEGYRPLIKIAEALQMDKYKTLSLNNIIASYTIMNGRLSLNKPITFKLDKTDFNITGSTGLDKTIDYDIAVKMPATELKKQANNLLSSIAPGINVPMSETVTVNLKLTGTTSDPKVKTSLNQIGKNAKDAVVEGVKKEVQQQKEQLQKQAQQEIDRQKLELQNKANQELQKQKQDLQNKADQEKKQLEDKGKKELKNQLKKLF
jgi:hypothetical protein